MKVVLDSNALLVAIGRRSLFKKPAVEIRAGHGDYLIANLSCHLSDTIGKGFSESNLKSIRQLYLFFPDYHQFSTQRIGNLSWTNIRTIMRLNDSKERNYYLKGASAQNWSSRLLVRNIRPADQKYLPISYIYNMEAAGPVYEGIVTFYSLAKRFGFIHSEAWGELFFFIDPFQLRALSIYERKKVKRKFVWGDEVYFKVRYSHKSQGPVAYDLYFIKNERLNRLMELLELSDELPGFIKKIDGCYYIKDRATYLFIPIHISKWETDLEETYEDRLNKVVTYSILKRYKNPEKWKATVTDRKFNETYMKLSQYKENNTVLQAKVIKMNRYGYYASILNGTINVFMLFNKTGNVPSTLQKGELIPVTIRSVNDSGILIKLLDHQ